MFSMLVRNVSYLRLGGAVVVGGPVDGRLRENAALQVEGAPAPALTVIGRGVAEPLRMRLGFQTLLLQPGDYQPEALIGKKLIQR